MRDGKIKNRWLYCSDKCSQQGKYLKAKQNGLKEQWNLKSKERKLHYGDSLSSPKQMT